MQEDLRAQIEDMIALVDNADMQSHQGVIVDISMLEGRVDALCRTVTSAEPALARSLQPLMADLITRLDALAVSLENFKMRYSEQ